MGSRSEPLERGIALAWGPEAVRVRLELPKLDAPDLARDGFRQIGELDPPDA